MHNTQYTRYICTDDSLQTHIIRHIMLYGMLHKYLFYTCMYVPYQFITYATRGSACMNDPKDKLEWPTYIPNVCSFKKRNAFGFLMTVGTFVCSRMVHSHSMVPYGLRYICTKYQTYSTPDSMLHTWCMTWNRKGRYRNVFDIISSN
jgi:hypothetical protein